MSRKAKTDQVRHRSFVAYEAKFAVQGRAKTVHKDRRLPRGGASNTSRDWLDEYLEEEEEQYIEEFQLLYEADPEFVLEYLDEIGEKE